MSCHQPYSAPESAAKSCATTTGIEEEPTQVKIVGRFNEHAAHYARYASIQRDMAAWLAQWLPAESATSVNQHALDLGAGDGTFTHFLAERFAQTTALDCAPQMLREGEHRLPQVRWIEGNAWTLEPLRQTLHSIDLITSASLLQWCRTPQDTLAHWAQQCRQGTRMLHGFYTEPTLQQWREIFGSETPIIWRDAAAWQQAFVKAGWTIVRCESETRDYRFASAVELARSLHGTGAIAPGGNFSAGRFRACLKQYEECYPIASAPQPERLHTFSTAGIASDKTPSGNAGMTVAGTHSAQHNGTNPSVFASWGFCRIEVVRA